MSQELATPKEVSPVPGSFQSCLYPWVPRSARHTTANRCNSFAVSYRCAVRRFADGPLRGWDKRARARTRARTRTAARMGGAVGCLDTQMKEIIERPDPIHNSSNNANGSRRNFSRGSFP